MDFRSDAKRIVRRVVRSTGYDLVPFVAGFAAAQQALLNRVDVLIDVGANVGQYAQRARALGFDGRLVSFEPTRRAYETLSRAARSDPKWETRNAALGSAPAELPINVSENSVSSSLLAVGDRHLQAAPASRTISTETVTVTTLDAALRDVPGTKFLKIDVQGYELEVLAGAEQALDDVLAIQLELSFTELYEGQPTWLEVSAAVERRGFTVWQLEPGYVDRASNRMLQCDALLVRDAGPAGAGSAARTH